MKCRKHPADPNSGIGVCSSCLRERLSAIIAAHAQKQAQVQQAQVQESRRKYDSQQASIVFPRSVSPYVSCRKSDAGAAWHLRYSSPQVAPASSVTVEIKKKSGGGRFSSLFSGLFKSKSEIPDGPISDAAHDSCASSPSWFSGVLPAREKKQIRTLSLDKNLIGGHKRNCCNPDRGMSPARHSNEEDDEHFHGGLSGYSSESSQGWKQIPRRTPATRRHGGIPGHCRNVSNLAFYLSPLVRASPNLQRNQKGIPPEMVVAGDVRIPGKPYLYGKSSFCKNRSRKLCDFGRNNRNH